MKWFVYVDAEYYAEAHIVEADSAEDAAMLAREVTHGSTYARYDDEGALGDQHVMGGRLAVPGCAVVPLGAVVFIGSENRLARFGVIRGMQPPGPLAGDALGARTGRRDAARQAE